MNPGRVIVEKKLYDLPGYYDIAFSYNLSGEIPFFTRCFQTYADGEVKLRFFDVFKRLSREGGFALKAVYNQSYEGVITLDLRLCASWAISTLF